MPPWIKHWFFTALFLIAVGDLRAQLVVTKMPPQTTWVEENTFKSRNGNLEQSCSVISVDDKNWRQESANTEAEIVISTCNYGRVASSQQPAPPASPSPGLSVEEIFSTLKSQAKYENVDIIGGIGYSRFRQVGPNGFTRTIWVDRSNGFPYRSLIEYGDGSTREQLFRKLSVDPNTQSRLFAPNTLFPFFGQHLDEWYARVTK